MGSNDEQIDNAANRNVHMLRYKDEWLNEFQKQEIQKFRKKENKITRSPKIASTDVKNFKKDLFFKK